MSGVRTFPVWECKIGVRGSVALPPGCDLPMRRAVEAAFKQVTGVDDEFNFSGWGGSLDEHELAVVENRMPSEKHLRDLRIRDAAPDLLEALQDLLALLPKIVSVDPQEAVKARAVISRALEGEEG